MEADLLGRIPKGAPDRACVSRPAAFSHAHDASRRRDVGDTRFDIVGRPGEGADRAGRQAGSVGAGVARSGSHLPSWHVDPLRKEKGSAVGMPKSIIGVDQDADGRGRDGFGPHRPALKRPVWWTLEWEQRYCAEVI